MSPGELRRVYQVKCRRCYVDILVEHEASRENASLALMRLGWRPSLHGQRGWVCADCRKWLPAVATR
jgi:hypothetical protein